MSLMPARGSGRKRKAFYEAGSCQEMSSGVDDSPFYSSFHVVSGAL
jgi:hypothetical protein